MAQVTKILVPIDFSPESGQALRDAAALARETWAQLIALHVIDENLETRHAVLDRAGRQFAVSRKWFGNGST